MDMHANIQTSVCVYVHASECAYVFVHMYRRVHLPARSPLAYISARYVRASPAALTPLVRAYVLYRPYNAEHEW